MHFRILVLVTLFHVAAVAPAILPRHRLLSDPVTKNIEYNSTRGKLESGGPPKWTVRPGIGHSVLFRVVLHEIIFPGNGQDCLSDAYVILTDSNNNSAIYCGSVKNREVRLLSLHLSIQIMFGSEFEANMFANISYEFFDPPEKQIVPVCSGITSDSTFGWYCKPYFYAPNFSETVCIQPAEICDGHNQCPNGEDEEMNVCSVANITSLHIQLLKNGTFFPRGGGTSLCISSAQTNCQEGDCESGCVDSLVSNASCPDQTFHCQEEAKCLPPSDVCNGLQECIGLSDESVAACEWRKNHADRLTNITYGDTSTLCPLGYPFFCPSDNTCLAVRAICNGFTDCSDGFDESEIVCKAASHYQKELINQTARNYSTVPVENTGADLFTTNITLDALEKTEIRCTKIDFSCPKETAEVGKRNVEELGEGSRNVEAVSASENIHSTTVADVEYREISSNFTYNKTEVDQEKSVVDFSSSTVSNTITTSLKEGEILDAKKCTDVLGTNKTSGGPLDTDRLQCADYNSAEEPETNKIKESPDRAITDIPITEESINKTVDVITDAISSQVIASHSEMNLNPCSPIDKQDTPFNETTNADLTTKKKKLALQASLESTSSLPTAKQKKKESLTESLLESSNSGLHSFVADLKVKHFNGVFTEPPVEPHGKSIGRSHASEVELGKSTSVLCNPLCKTNSSEAKNLDKSNHGSVHQRYNFTDGLTLNRAEINAMVMPGSDIKGEIAFPPLWIARISSGPFFLCYGVLLADGSTSRWVLIPASCGRYLQSSTMLVHFGAGIDNYE
ncbi:unnamed protein product [Hydatigera taeniaeformis]|uniref:Low-density lipoprotein receptor domain class A n=1 Tax=Hydatigena taeniaeformis TaxID=6205 RepID=A0A0R3WRP6_HYDTA|nr:unnamed protein product [Hydatigera taeniaeformis]